MNGDRMAREAPHLGPLKSAEALGAMVRSRRKSMGLTIQDVMQLTGLGNRFLVELENGKPTVRLDKVLVALRGLGIELAAADALVASADGDDSGAEAILRARRQARALKVAHDRVLRRMHQRIARLLRDKERAPALIERASAMVSLWEAKKTCSPVYVAKWRDVLANPVHGLRNVVLDPKAPYGAAMLQNSPFGFLLADVEDGEAA